MLSSGLLGATSPSSGSLGATSLCITPAAGCPRVNESLLLLQTISDIFADNATLSRLPPPPAAPARPPPRGPRSTACFTAPASPSSPRPPPRPAGVSAAAAAQPQSRAEQPAPLAAL